MFSLSNTMSISILVFLYLPVLVLCGGTCECSKEKFVCSNITQDELFHQIIKQRSCWNGNITEINISNSDDFAVIEEFPNLQELINIDPNRTISLVIRNSSVQRISDGAFLNLDFLEKIDLSENQIKNLTFVNTLPSSTKEIILRDNDIEEIDLNLFPTSRYNSKATKIVDFSKNNISLILPAYRWMDNVYSLDLSYNKLKNFNETELGYSFDSLNLNYNLITDSIELKNNKNLFSILGNNITSLKYNKPYSYNGVIDIRKFYLNFIPRDSLPFLSSISIINSPIKHLNNENKMKFQIFKNPPRIDIDLSNTSLISISENYFQNLTIGTLKLNNNNLKVLNQSLFSGCKLNSLDLSNCGIEIITKEVFNDFSINNTIPFHHSSFDYNNYDRFEALNLSRNLIDHFENICEKLIHLENLDLSLNKFTRINSSTFFRCFEIKYLDLSKNKIRTIEIGSFSSLHELVSLDLSNNLIDVMGITYFGAHLKTINLSNNKLKTLENCTYKHLQVSKIYLEGNEIRRIKSRDFDTLNNLKNLNLSNFQINQLEPLAFVNLRNLKSIDLRNNNITGIQPNVFKHVNVKNMYLNKITQPIHLDNTVIIKNLNLQFNGVLDKGTVSNAYLKSLTLIDSRIESMRNNCLVGNYDLEELVFVNSRVSELEPRALNGLLSLTKLDLSSSFESISTLHPNIFEGLNNLKELYLNRNKLTTINQEIFAPLKSTLYLLDLSENDFVHIPPFDLVALGNYLPNLKILNVSSSSIKDLSNRKKFIFGSNAIEVLDLSNNKIQSLYGNAFKTFSNLEKLFLNNNNLKNIEDQSFFHTKSLKELRLDGNNLYRLPDGVFNGLKQLTSLNISHNPIIDE